MATVGLKGSIVLHKLAALLLLLALSITPPDPGLTARWDGPGASVVSWTQTTRGCLYKNETFIACYETPGEYRITFGRVGLLDGTLRPRVGDVYVLWTPEGTWRAALRGVVRLAVVLRSP